MAGLIPFGHRHGISRGFDDLGFWDGSFMRSFFNGSDGFTNFKKDGVLKIVLPKSGEEKKKSQKPEVEFRVYFFAKVNSTPLFVVISMLNGVCLLYFFNNRGVMLILSAGISLILSFSRIS